MTDDSKLKNHLVNCGLLTEEQVLRAEDYALTTKMPLDEAIVFLKLLDYAALGQGLADLYNKTYCGLLERVPSDPAKAKVTLKTAERLQIFPVDFNQKNRVLTLATHDPDNEQLQTMLGNSFPAPIRIEFTVASRPEILMAIGVHYEGKAYTPEIALEVPVEFTIAAQNAEKGKMLDLEKERQSDKKILLLEPDLDRSRALVTLLRKEGFPAVRWVGSQEEAANVLKTEPADLLLANGRAFMARGAWVKEASQDIDLPPISYYNIKSMLLGQEHAYNHMSDALASLLGYVVRSSLKNYEEQLQEMVTRVRYCKLLAMRLGLTPVQVDASTLAAWLSCPGLGERLLDHMTTPYHLDEILRPEQSPGNSERIETAILTLVRKYQTLKKTNPEAAGDMDLVRKELISQTPSPENKSLLEAFFHVIRDEEFLKGVERSSVRILIVDPEYSEGSSLVLRLSNDGYDVTGVPDANKAVKVILGSGIDLIISEVNLPGTDGMKFCQILRKNSNTAQVPFFFITAEEGERLAAECLGAGADDFLEKPVDLELVSLKIQRILAIKAPKETKRGITGTLDDMSTSDIIQSLTTGDKDVEVNLQSNGEKGHIYIQEGEIVHARTDDMDGEDAFYRLMAWQKGAFEIVSCSAFPSRTIHGSTMSLLMEGARLADEIDTADEVGA